MLYSKIIAVCSQIHIKLKTKLRGFSPRANHIHIKHINTLCGQNVGLLNVKLVVNLVTIGNADPRKSH